jgi:hypothetical protein
MGVGKEWEARGLESAGREGGGVATVSTVGRELCCWVAESIRLRGCVVLLRLDLDCVMDAAALRCDTGLSIVTGTAVKMSGKKLRVSMRSLAVGVSSGPGGTIFKLCHVQNPAPLFRLASGRSKRRSIFGK